MSCYNWEHGTIKIPAGQWATFRKGLLTKWNARKQETLDLAVRALKAAKEDAKGKRGDKRKQAMLDSIARTCGTRITWDTWVGRVEGQYNSDRLEAVLMVLTGDTYGFNGTIDLSHNLISPKKKDAGKVPVSKGCTIRMPEASVTFDNETKTITWGVPENNRAVERARVHWFAKALFAALDRIDWKRGSGGEIVGNDEYNRDSHDSGGGGNYVTKTYGCKTARKTRGPRPPQGGWGTQGSYYYGSSGYCGGGRYGGGGYFGGGYGSL